MHAPIALFAYNRPLHTKHTVDALLRNPLSRESDLFIFSDAAKNASADSDVAEVRNYVRKINGFRSVSVIERDKNFGLARSIIDGVSELCEKYGKVIVLEDDVVVTPGFLTFMNQSLERYRCESSVWHISGWNYPINPEGLPEVFFWRMMNCWGWATWSDRWKAFEKNPAELIWRHSRDKEWIHRFDIDGTTGSWSQVVANFEGRLNTWAIFWAATIFERGGLCLNPTTSFVKNIGHDGSGVNCGIIHSFSGDVVRNECVTEWPDQYVENAEAVSRIGKFLRSVQPSFLHRVAKLFRISKHV